MARGILSPDPLFDRRMKLVIYLPALNEEESIGRVLEALPRTIAGATEIISLVVDDGSSDRTSEIAESAGAMVVRHGQTVGVGGVFHTALEKALVLGADVLVSIDADGQFDAGEIPELIAPILQGEADFVTGNRFHGGKRPENMPPFRYWGNKQITRLLGVLAGVELSDVSCGFRAYSREALLNLNLFGKFTYTQETILDLAFKNLRLAEVPVTVKYFLGRQSRVAGSIARYAMNTSKIILRTVRDFRPLRFFGVMGLVLFSMGAILDVWIAMFYLRTGSFSPFKIVGFAGLVLNGAGFLVGGLGLVADMLDRMRVNQERLLYFEKKRIYDEQHPGRRGQ